MNVENTYDEVIFAAMYAGLEPGEDDLDSVRVPADQDEDTFRRELVSTAREIAELRRAGNGGEAQRLAAEAQATYLDSFAHLMPIASGGDPESYEDAAARMFGPDQELAEAGKRMFGR